MTHGQNMVLAALVFLEVIRWPGGPVRLNTIAHTIGKACLFIGLIFEIVGY